MDLSIKGLRVDSVFGLKGGNGPGSRGGHIVGTTSTGKPIYANLKHPAHRRYTPAERTEVKDLHGRLEGARYSKSKDAQGGAKDFKGMPMAELRMKAAYMVNARRPRSGGNG